MLDERARSCPTFSGDRAGAVGQLKLQPGGSGANGSANFFFANEKERGDALSVREIDDEMRLHQPLTFGSGSFFFFFLGVVRRRSDFLNHGGPGNGGAYRYNRLHHHITFLAQLGEIVAHARAPFFAV